LDELMTLSNAINTMATELGSQRKQLVEAKHAADPATTDTDKH
jgi:nitrogen fixation/metabolism regulation signal transduction histidine kinase